ncbi:unnamed protein product [Clonostachys rosea]|uniref:Bacteriophage T5 Orf172 DNA-binding domain-containing protein n=1 Tax=Bionectria ochroleuca TaxID=29856 RepID=A0ABY6US73_BIOOC|nr:unnamed protein product [Clonostachys rosea]
MANSTMNFNESRPSKPEPTDIERFRKLKKALGLPLEGVSICLATTKTEEQCGATISHKEIIDPTLASLLKPFPVEPSPINPALCSSGADGLLSRLVQASYCPLDAKHKVTFTSSLSIDDLRDQFRKWKSSEEDVQTDNEASTAGTDQCQQHQTPALDEGPQLETVQKAAFDDHNDDEYKEQDEDDEDDNEDHNDPDYQPSERLNSERESDWETNDSENNDCETIERQVNEYSKGRHDNEPERTSEEVPKDISRGNPGEQARHDREDTLHATDIKAPTALTSPPRTANNSSKSASVIGDDVGSPSEASSPVPSIWSPLESSLADTPDTECTTTSSERRYRDNSSESPSLNRGSSLRSGKRTSYFSLPTPPLLQPQTQELPSKERQNTTRNGKNQKSSEKKPKASGRLLLHPSTTLKDGTKTADIYKMSGKSNPLNDIFKVMRSIAHGDRLLAGHVYAYIHKSVPEHIKIGYAKDERRVSEKSHIVLHPVVDHKDLHLWDRLKEQEAECMDEMKVLFAVYMPSAAGQMERLVHRTLYKEKRVAKCQIPGCGKEHIEWFRVEEKRALDVVIRWAKFSELLPYNSRGCLRENWDIHAYEHGKEFPSMPLEEWWDKYWNKFRDGQKAVDDRQLAAALEEEERSQLEENSLLDVQLEIQLERNRLQQERNGLEQCATVLREEKVKRDLERARQRRQELQRQMEKLSLI